MTVSYQPDIMKVPVENEPKLDIKKMIVDNKQKTIIIAVAVALVIVAGIVFWYGPKSKQSPSVPSPQIQELPQDTPQEAPTLGSEIFEKTQNPLKGQVPETNPFKEQKNPFDTIYQNPFQ